jgi:hypothetical protein
LSSVGLAAGQSATVSLSNGYALTADINLDGTTTITDYSPQLSVLVVPEPSTMLPLGSGLAGQDTQLLDRALEDREVLMVQWFSRSY